jgi:hypothetical protein
MGPIAPVIDGIATTFRLLLSRIDSGEISADRPQERGMVRQIRGALALAETLVPEPEEPFIDI